MDGRFRPWARGDGELRRYHARSSTRGSRGRSERSPSPGRQPAYRWTRATTGARRRWRLRPRTARRRWSVTCSTTGRIPARSETFFGASVLDFSLWKGAPDFRDRQDVARRGCRGSGVTALAQALESGDLDLARAAAASGPLTETDAADLRAQLGELDGEPGEILASVKTEPDPPPPSYSARQLAEFAGSVRRSRGSLGHRRGERGPPGARLRGHPDSR